MKEEAQSSVEGAAETPAAPTDSSTPAADASSASTPTENPAAPAEAQVEAIAANPASEAAPATAEAAAPATTQAPPPAETQSPAPSAPQSPAQTPSENGTPSKKKKKGFLSKIFKSSHHHSTPATPAAAPAASSPAPSPASTETWTVHLAHQEGTPLGMKIMSDDRGVLISDVVANSIAANSGHIKTGDFILKINDFSVAGATHEQVVKALSATELNIVFGKNGLGIQPTPATAAGEATAPAPAEAPTPVEAVAVPTETAAPAAVEAAAPVEATAVSEEAAVSAPAPAQAAAATATTESVAAAPVAATTSTPPTVGAGEHLITITKNGSGPLGMRLEDGDNGVVVTEVTKHSPAVKAGVKTGMRIVAVNDSRWDKSSVEEVTTALRTAGAAIYLVVVHAPPKKSSGLFFSKKSSKKEISQQPATVAAATATATAATATTPAPVSATGTQNPYVKIVSLNRGPGGLGMRIRSDENSDYTYISEILPGGAAEASHQLNVGDFLVEINGVKTHNATQEEIVGSLAKPKVDLHVVSHADLPAFTKHEEGETSKTQRVHLTNEGKGYGISVSAKDGVVFVTGLTPGCPAHTSGKILVNDQIVSINGQAVKTVPEFQKAFVSSEKAVEMVITHPSNGEISPQKGSRRFSLKLFDKFGGSKKEAKPAAASVAATAAPTAPTEPEPTPAAAPASAAPSAPADSNVRKVHLVRGEQGLGMKIKSDDPKNGVCVYELTPGGVAAVSGQVNVGDIILEVNGRSVINLNHEEVVDELRKGQEVDLVLTGAFPASEKPTRRSVSLTRTGEETFGLVLDDANPGVKISGITSGSVAEKSGQVNVGDFILAVNSIVVLTYTSAEVNQMLQSETIELTLINQFPSSEYESQAVAEDLKVQAQEAAVRQVAAQAADDAMDEEQAQRITQEKMATVQEELLRNKSREDVTAAVAAEQARQVEAAEQPSEEMAEKKNAVQDQLLSEADRKAAAAAEEEERQRRIAENRKMDMHDQLLSEADRKAAAAAEAEEQNRRVAEGQHIPPSTAALKHAVEEEIVKTHKNEEETVVVVASTESAAPVALEANGVASAAPTDGKKYVLIDRGDQPLGLKIAGIKSVTVEEITAGSAAHKAGGIAVGDQIVEVNGKSFVSGSNTTYDEILHALKTAGPSVLIGYITPVSERRKSKSFFSRKEDKGRSSSGEIGNKTVVLKRGSNGLGLRLHTEGSRLGIVSEVLSNSPASHAHVAVGDKILEINGSSVEGKSGDQLLTELKDGAEVTLLLQPTSARRSSRFSLKIIGLGGSKGDKASQNNASPAVVSAAPAASASSPPADTAEVPAAEADSQKEVQQLRFRVADLELSKAASEKRVQTLTSELNEALEEINRLRAAAAAGEPSGAGE